MTIALRMCRRAGKNDGDDDALPSFSAVDR
jgi:hypothetical protein